LIVAAAALICIRLGIWQIDRLAQRREFNSHFLTMSAMAPLVLPALANPEEMEYRQVVAEGIFDYSQQVAIRNQYYQGQYGFHLLTPMALSDGSAILADRGWIPYEENSSRSNWEKYNIDGVVKIIGVIRLSRERADITSKSDPELLPGQQELQIWNFPNIPRIESQMSYELLPVYIQVAPSPTNEVLPIAELPVVEISEGPHLGYALQWFTFAGIFLMLSILYKNSGQH
jgi:surfeit locus 1 family protein